MLRSEGKGLEGTLVVIKKIQLFLIAGVNVASVNEHKEYLLLKLTLFFCFCNETGKSETGIVLYSFCMGADIPPFCEPEGVSTKNHLSNTVRTV